MSMMPVCELWVPDPSKAFLQCKAASYAGYEGFGRQSHGVAFAKGEGLPGRVWATKRPEILATLDAPSDFVRARAAADADLSAGFGLPIIRNNEVTAVLTFLIAQGPEPSGVMEVWSPSDGRELTWRSGFYGQLEEIREVSVTTTFKKGQGLPGRVWESRRPEIVESLWQHSNGEFVREEAAMVAGLTMGFAIPVIHSGEVQSIATMLSTSDMPFAKVMEVWIPNDEGTALRKINGYYGRYAKFTDDQGEVSFARGEGVPGQVWESGEPQLIAPLDANSGFARYQAAQSVDLSVAIGIPILDGATVNAVFLILN